MTAPQEILDIPVDEAAGREAEKSWVRIGWVNDSTIEAEDERIRNRRSGARPVATKNTNVIQRDCTDVSAPQEAS